MLFASSELFILFEFLEAPLYCQIITFFAKSKQRYKKFGEIISCLSINFRALLKIPNLLSYWVLLKIGL